MILGLKTDNPTAELVLLGDGGALIEREEWLAERRLAKELLGRLEALLQRHDADWTKLGGLIVFKGPGSFTGLRIGITVMNTIAYAQAIPIVGQQGERWREDGAVRLGTGEDDGVVLPEYGAPARITTPKK